MTRDPYTDYETERREGYFWYSTGWVLFLAAVWTAVVYLLRGLGVL